MQGRKIVRQSYDTPPPLCRCDGRTGCDVPADIAPEAVCPETEKYLEAHYYCLDPYSDPDTTTTGLYQDENLGFETIGLTECPKMYSKSVLHLLK